MRYFGRFNLNVIGLQHAPKHHCMAWGACPYCAATVASLNAGFGDGDG